MSGSGKATKCMEARVPNPDFLFYLRDYSEDDNLEFIAHESTINKGEQVETKKGGKEVDPLLTRELEGESEATASREGAPTPNR